MSDSESSEINAEENEQNDAAGENIEETADVKKTVIPRRPKLDSTRIFENSNGIERVFRDFPRLNFPAGNSAVSNLDILMNNFQVWASQLYPFGLNIQDFARSVETELQPEAKRRKIYELRSRYLKDQGAFGETVPTEDELAVARAEANRQKALEKRRLREEGIN